MLAAINIPRIQTALHDAVQLACANSDNALRNSTPLKRRRLIQQRPE